MGTPSGYREHSKWALPVLTVGKLIAQRHFEYSLGVLGLLLGALRGLTEGPTVGPLDGAPRPCRAQAAPACGSLWASSWPSVSPLLRAPLRHTGTERMPCTHPDRMRSETYRLDWRHRRLRRCCARDQVRWRVPECWAHDRLLRRLRWRQADERGRLLRLLSSCRPQDRMRRCRLQQRRAQAPRSAPPCAPHSALSPASPEHVKEGETVGPRKCIR